MTNPFQLIGFAFNFNVRRYKEGLNGPHRTELLANPLLQTSLVRSVFARGQTEEATRDMQEASCAALMYLSSEVGPVR
jgi:hypothetical protein